MTPRMPMGWQVLLADLSLILFIATAAAVAGQSTSQTQSSLRSTPSATIFTSLTTGEDIGGWLADYISDPRERLWITIHYRNGDFTNAVERAQQVEATAVAAGRIPNITLERSEDNQTIAFFAFDEPLASADRTASTSLAQGLQ